MTAPELRAGTLYLVATPIGNLEDITLRALRTLREVDLIAAEDTRHTGRLLAHFGIVKPLLSYYRFNEARRATEIVERLQQGKTIALVSDAGTPGISDPGEWVVRAVIAAGLRVEAVPGPSAVLAALAVSGLPTDEFRFIGFLPHKSGQRRKQLAGWQGETATLVLYESPYRIGKLIDELCELMPERPVVIARELTKKFEEVIRGKPAEIRATLKDRVLKGEMVVLIGRA